MKETKKEGESSFSCGYGLLGLCCSNCLLGPCRIGPFEKDSEKGLCGDTSDLIVAKKLFRLVAGEALEGLSFLKRAVERVPSSGTGNSLGRRLSARDRRGIVEKYGLPPKTTRKALSRYVLKEAEKLFAPISQEKSVFLETLYPERIFPFLYQHRFPLVSLMGFLLDSIRSDPMESSDVEENLWQCLRISAIGLICHELAGDIRQIVGQEDSSRGEGGVLDALKGLSSDPSAVMILAEDERIDSKEPMYQTAQKIRESIKGEVLTFSVKKVSSLPEIGRRLTEKWALPVSEMRILVLVSSPLASWTLGTLALGFSAISFPALPIHGSEEVERFFSESLKKRFGHVYFLSWEENLLNKVLEYLR